MNHNLKTIKKAGAFVSVVTFSAFLLNLFAPITFSYAVDKTAEVNVSVNPMISLTLNTSNLQFDISPSPEGVFESKPLIATVDTNSTGGYELYFSSEDNTTDMTSLTSSSVVASDFTGTVTSSTMGANKWAYSLDNTDFSKIPTLANQVALRNLNHLPTSSEVNTTVNIAVKINNLLPSGDYSKKVTFTAIAHATPTVTIGMLHNMQQITSEVCSNSITHETGTLTDLRDGNTYTVAKLKDGKCWMTQDLKIANYKATSADSDVDEDFDIPVSSSTGFNPHTGLENAYVVNNSGYYTWYVATAGTGTRSMTQNNIAAEKSICPKGWRLPTGYQYSGDFYMLSQQYSDFVTAELPHFTKTGYMSSGSLSYTNYGIYHSSTNHGERFQYVLGIDNNNSVTPSGDGYKGEGYKIRCVAR